jgi:hypothetical protein
MNPLLKDLQLLVRSSALSEDETITKVHLLALLVASSVFPSHSAP